MTLYRALLTPGSEKKMLYDRKTAMCREALSVSTAGQGQGSRMKALHKQTRVSGDAEAPGTSTVEMQLIGCESCKRNPGWTQKIPAWDLTAPLRSNPT